MDNYQAGPNLGTKLHLSWDGTQNNGIIFNDKYTWGALYQGQENKPNIGIDYHSLNYSEVFIDNGYDKTITLYDGSTRELTIDEINKIRNIAGSWVQPYGQEGNPTPLQIKQKKQAMAQGMLKSTSFIILDDMIGLFTKTEINKIKKFRKALIAVLKDGDKDLPEITLEIRKILGKFRIDPEKYESAYAIMGNE